MSWLVTSCKVVWDSIICPLEKKERKGTKKNLKNIMTVYFSFDTSRTLQNLLFNIFANSFVCVPTISCDVNEKIITGDRIMIQISSNLVVFVILWNLHSPIWNLGNWMSVHFKSLALQRGRSMCNLYKLLMEETR